MIRLRQVRFVLRQGEREGHVSTSWDMKCRICRGSGWLCNAPQLPSGYERRGLEYASSVRSIISDGVLDPRLDIFSEHKPPTSEQILLATQESRDPRPCPGCSEYLVHDGNGAKPKCFIVGREKTRKTRREPDWPPIGRLWLVVCRVLMRETVFLYNAWVVDRQAATRMTLAEAREHGKDPKDSAWIEMQ
jgi:hypothetical protein